MEIALNNFAGPRSTNLFRTVPSSRGSRLALVFGNHAPNGVCPFAASSLCHHCDIGDGEGEQYDIERNRQRLLWFASHHANDLTSIANLVIYNSGSVLNPREMPSEFLTEILSFAAQHSSIKSVSLDTRESFVTVERIRQAAAHLRSDQCLRIIIGLESADDHIRNEVLQKQMPREAIERAFQSVSHAAPLPEKHRLGIDVNVLVGGPGTTSESAMADAAATAGFALARSEVSVDFNIHPYYRSRRGIAQFPAHPGCSRSLLARSVRAIHEVCRAAGSASQLFIGLNHEGHDLEPVEVDARPFECEVIDRFNATQDVGLLADWV